VLFSEKFACPDHGVSLPELQPRIFSFNSPHGACPRCTVWVRSRRSTRICSCRHEPVDLGGRARALVRRQLGLLRIGHPGDRGPYEIPLDEPWENLSEEEEDLFLYGTEGERLYVSYRNRMGRRRSYMLAFEGIIPSLERRYRETDSASQRERIEEYMSFRPCPVCNGARLKPEVLAVTVGEKNIHQFTQMSVTRALEFLDKLQLTETSS